MNGLTWSMLILAALIGAFLFATLGAGMLAIAFARVSGKLAGSDDRLTS